MRASIIISFHYYPTQVIVGSASYIAEDPHPPLHEIYRNNESVSPNPRNPLENYTLYSVDMVDGVLCDTIKFKTDKIFLSHNQVKALESSGKFIRDYEFTRVYRSSIFVHV